MNQRGEECSNVAEPKVRSEPTTTRTGEDSRWVQQALRGDQDAFECLVLRYQDRVYRLLLNMTGSTNEAEDLTQDTFLKAYRALETFREGSQFYTWLFRIAVNTSYSRGRKLKTRATHEVARLEAATSEDGQTLGDLLEGASEQPYEKLQREDLQRKVRDGLAKLPEDYRVVVALRDLDGHDYGSIAELLSISKAAVKSRLHRARQELARLLSDLKPENC
jgi:RNA polymerase sigma-70 factor (ECF subfamily)